MNISPQFPLFEKESSYSLKGIAILCVILHHCYQHSVQKMELPDFCPPMGYEFGSFAVALFFVLSGYGMFLSMRRNTLNRQYIFSQLKKLYTPFVIIYILRLLSFISLGIMEWDIHCIPEFLIMHFPMGENWFMKVIVGAYITSFLTLKFIKNDYIAILIMFAISTLYFNTAPRFGLGGYWYYTSLNFAFGMLLAKAKEKIQTHSIPTLICLGVMFCAFYLNKNIIVCGSLISLLAIIVIRYINIKNVVLDYMGHHSWIFYLSHGIFLYIYPSVISNNWMFYPFFVLGGTSIVVFCYNYVARSISKFINSPATQ